MPNYFVSEDEWSESDDNDNDYYDIEEISLTKYNIVLCELYNKYTNKPYILSIGYVSLEELKFILNDYDNYDSLSRSFGNDYDSFFMRY